jgi:3-methyladenine DNA glycosylase/8-oxoguanine DNA glycosylase
MPTTVPDRSDEAADLLDGVLTVYGADGLRDPAMMSSALRRLMPDAPDELNVLVDAAACDVVSILRAFDRYSEVEALDYATVALSERSDLPPHICAWGVAAIASALRRHTTSTSRLVTWPDWFDWQLALKIIDRELRVPGETINLAGGRIVTPCRLADVPALLALEADVLSGGARWLEVRPPTEAAAQHAVDRFHLDLDAQAVSAALDRTGLPLPDKGWLRRPAAAALWPYLLCYLAGGDPDSQQVTLLFGELGSRIGLLTLAPEPADILGAGEGRLTSYGIAPHRAANVLGLAQVFATRPEYYDEVTLRQLPANEAVARLAKLPHIGKARAAEIASGPLGHDDVLPDLSRRAEQLRRTLGLSWAEVLASAERAAPYRSVLGDTLAQALASED